jgi:hypothetical protein
MVFGSAHPVAALVLGLPAQVLTSFAQWAGMAAEMQKSGNASPYPTGSKLSEANRRSWREVLRTF